MKKARKRRQFLIDLAKELAGLQEDNAEMAVVTDTEDPPRKKRRCYMCESKKDRKTKTVCKKCKRNVCGEHSRVLCNRCVSV